MTTIEFTLPEHIRRFSHSGAVNLEHVAFRDNILNGTNPLTDAEVGWWSTVIPLAAERAVAERRVVEIGEFTAACDSFHQPFSHSPPAAEG